jgi:hypothetical protein
MTFEHLSIYIAPDNGTYSDAWTRVLSRLGEYTASILQALNMRPTEVALLGRTSSHVLVRVSTPREHLVLRIAPEKHLLSEVFFGRTMNTQRLPSARIEHFDLKRSLVPFDYMLESYVCGISAAQLDGTYTDHLCTSLARQVGRTLRRMQRVRVGGWGHPTASGRWMVSEWETVLTHLHQISAPQASALVLFREHEQAAIDALLKHPLLTDVQPCLMHGAFSPEAVRCTIGEHVQLEALVDPGSVIAGDGLLDLAYGLNPAFSQQWRAGLLAGYAAAAPLTPTEQQRLRLLQLFTCYWSACQAYARAEPHEAAHTQALTLLEEHWPQAETLLAAADTEDE